jgi:hypothetical protein
MAVSTVKYGYSATDDDPALLHIPNKEQFTGLAVEALEFIQRRIRELNGVDETDPCPVCSGCMSTVIGNIPIIMTADVIESGNADMMGYVASGSMRSISDQKEAARTLAIAYTVGKLALR